MLVIQFYIFQYHLVQKSVYIYICVCARARVCIIQSLQQFLLKKKKKKITTTMGNGEFVPQTFPLETLKGVTKVTNFNLNLLCILIYQLSFEFQFLMITVKN